ncbi:MAG: hypothetical protein FK734_17190 [Asgard group archaeon]|nr:hypothetical protein [Asgard group archaeon]
MSTLSATSSISSKAKPEKIEINITNIIFPHSYQLIESVNYSSFLFMVDFLVTNPNEEDITLSFDNIGPIYLVNITYQLENSSIVFNSYRDIVLVPTLTEYVVKSGTTENSTFLYLITEDLSITKLPEGEYILFVCFRELGETNLISVRARVIIEGYYTHYEYNYSVPAGFSIIDCMIITVAFSLIGGYFFFKKKRQ